MREYVSIVRCRPDVTDEEVAVRTEQAIAALPDFGVGLRTASLIAVKINAGIARLVETDGRQTELTDPAVVLGALRAIRSVTSAPIVMGDASTGGGTWDIYRRLGYPEMAARFADVRMVDFNASDLVDMPTRAPEPLFSRYTVPRELAEADAFVSLAKMKAHTSVGCTLCMKNLFGWLPTAVYGTPRNYLHDRLIRLPRVLSELALTLRPCLNVVDATVAANMSEWHGTALRPGLILAGTNIVATDAVGMRCMGFDPWADYPRPPFHYRRSCLLLAHEAGLGPVDAGEIGILGPAPEDVGTPFEVRKYEGRSDRDEQLVLGAECVSAYRRRQEEYSRSLHRRYLAFGEEGLRWHASTMDEMIELERIHCKDWRSVPRFVVRCVPPAEEIERFDLYEAEAEAARARMSLAGVG